MAQYDYYRFADGLLVDVQSDLMSDLNVRVAIPLLPKDRSPIPAERLNPLIEIDGRHHVLVTQFMAAMTLKELGETAGSLIHERDRIKAAVDMIFDGF